MTKTTEIDSRARSKALVEAGIRAGSPGAKEVGSFLASVRMHRKESRAETATKLGVSPTVYRAWERGAAVPGERSMIAIRRWFGKAESDRFDTAIATIGRRAGRAMHAAEAREALGLPPRPDLGADGMSVLAGPKTGRPKTGKSPMASPGIRPEDVPVLHVDADEALLVALIESSLPARAKALLSAAIVALAAGIDVEVQVNARV